MRIHSDTLTMLNLYEAARTARVEFDRFDAKGSRKRDHAFDVTLFGESRRRPNNRGTSGPDDYAATWDQWGVFLAFLFNLDPDMATPYYADADEFDYRTNRRFEKRTKFFTPGGSGVVVWWPADAHGDHTFRFSGTPLEQSCTKCSAVQRWM